MKLVLALTAAATLFSTAALANETLHGTVHTYCMNGASTCRAILDTTVDGASKSVTLSGDFQKMAKYSGKDVTVSGYWMCLNGGDSCRFGVTHMQKARAPKPTGETMIGVVHTYCMNGADTCRAILDTNVAGIPRQVALSGDFSKLAAFNGQPVSVEGYSMCLNGGDTCRFGVTKIERVAAIPETLVAGSNAGRNDATMPVSGSSASGFGATSAVSAGTAR